MMFSFFNFGLKKKIQIPHILKEFYKVFEKNGFEAYLVGGAVRDIFLGQKASDWDVATNAFPQDVMRIFKFVVPTGIEHGTVTVHFMKTEIEVTTFRTETSYSDGRHPDKVNYAATIKEDLRRRDFTMNAIAVNLKDGKIADPYSGRRDIKRKLIRTAGNAHDRFMEDGLRPVRAIRFAAKLNFSIEKDTYSEIFKEEIQKKVLSISIERFRDEFEKMIKAEKPSVGLKLMEETGILKLFIPELAACRGCIQSDYRGFHKFDVIDHLFYACDGAPASKENVRLAALFHDIGKPLTKQINTENGVETLTFYNHEKTGKKITRQIMIRLKFSNEMINSVCHLVEQHMFHYEQTWTDAAVRRFIIRATPQALDDLFDLRLADMYGMFNTPVDSRSQAVSLLIELKDRITEILAKQNVLSLKNLAVNGKDLMKEGIPAGRQLGIILNELLECVIEDPSMNEKNRLMEIAKKLFEKKQI